MEEKSKSRSVATLHNLLDMDACRLMNAELHVKDILPAWIAKAESVKLKTFLQKYLRQVEDHIYQMHSFLSEECIQLPVPANTIITAITLDAEEKMALCTDVAVRDACLLACLQSINHYKIFAYSTLVAFAEAIGLKNAVATFRRAESNEKSMDDRLSRLATLEINKQALAAITLPDPGSNDGQ